MATNSHPVCLSCCQTIIKTFERGAAYAVTEESTFALMTAPLSNMRTSARSFIQHEESIDILGSPATTKQKSSPITSTASQAINLRNLDKANEDDEGFFKQIRGNFTDNQVEGTGNLIDADLFGGIFNSECIPCGERLNTLGEMNVKLDLENYAKQWLEMWKKAFQDFLGQIQDLLDVFNNLDQFVDLCALLDFLKDFVCIPDLQRILAALMALMAKVSFELGGVFDLILGLIGPILSPFLSGLVDMLMKYLLLIIRPIECIIDALQDILRKLDYNVLFQNIEKLNKSTIPKSRTAVSGTIKIPFFDVEWNKRDEVTGETRGPLGVPNLNAVTNTGATVFNDTTDVLGGSAIKEENAKNQANVDRAAKELRALEAAASNLDLADAAATERYRKQKKEANKRYQSAIEKRDLSAIGRTNLAIDRHQTAFKGALFELVAQLREAVETVEAFVADIVDEFRKIMGEYVGGQSGIVAQIIKKFAVVQMIGLITTIISAFMRGDLGCDDEENRIRPESIIDPQQGLKIWTDNNGDIHIEEDPDELDRALRAAVRSIGGESGGDPEDQIGKDQGESSDTPGQKLKNLIEFTGDPVLDTEIARTTEALITPTKVTFKCPLQTSVSNAEQINQWIQSLNT